MKKETFEYGKMKLSDINQAAGTRLWVKDKQMARRGNCSDLPAISEIEFARKRGSYKVEGRLYICTGGGNVYKSFTLHYSPDGEVSIFMVHQYDAVSETA